MPANRLEERVGQRTTRLLHCGNARRLRVPLNRKAAGVQDPNDGRRHFRADAVARDQRDGVCHEDQIIIICVVDDPALEWIAEASAHALANVLADGEPSASAVLFLLRHYAVSGREQWRDAIELGLTGGLDAFPRQRDPRTCCQWLGVFAEAAAISDDERIVACVQASLGSTIDALEQLARADYEPGEGLLGAELADQLRSASAFLTAFELTGRLPYSMLAEELLQVARRRSWDDRQGRFDGDFSANASAVQVLCQLATLHADAEYAASAVVAHDASYARDAERILASLAPIAHQHLTSAPEYGMALLNWFALRALPN